MDKIQWKPEVRKIKDLHENPKNPRKLSKHDAEHLELSLEKFGVCEPIVINQDGQIIGGHQRVRTLKKKKIKEVNVVVPDVLLSQEEADELSTRLNKNSGDWDFDILANQWNPDDLVEWGFLPEELGIEFPEKEKEEEKKRCFSIIVTFPDMTSLEETEKKIEDVIFSIPGTSYEVKVK